MRQHIEKFKPYFPASFFIGGFVFDLLTVSRIDESLQLIQQFVYLVIIGWLLVAEKSPRVESFFASGFRLKIWEFRYEIIHFLLGSLLSVYMIFYFKSASLASAFIFIIIMSALLVLNEFTVFKELGGFIRFGLFALCSCSYFIYLVPIIWQQIGFFTFMFSLILSGIVFTSIFYFLAKYEHLTTRQLMIEAMLPGIGVHLLFFLLYIFKFLPPVPLSIEKIGVFHKLEKVNGEYVLYYDRPWWKFWQSGAQDFVAGPEDKIHVFASVFAPNFFREKVSMDWYQKELTGWHKMDSIAMQIAGGREKGFRGYSVKSNFTPGEWQVRVVTSDEREIGRIYIHVEKDPDVIHEFETEQY
jgi:hypothetical protein